MVSEAGKEVEIIALEGLISIVVNGTKGRSWVYDYVLKIGTDENIMVHVASNWSLGRSANNHERSNYKYCSGETRLESSSKTKTNIDR
jgi:hypothetical protein